jgi:phenylacetate-CoA ligase
MASNSSVNESALWLVRDARKARKQGASAVESRWRSRLAEIVAFARSCSPYYRELYREVPERVEDPALLPVTNKRDLMARFNDWATDRAVTIEGMRAFVSDRDLIGERFLGKYIVAVTSGTTGRPGMFLMDDRSLAVTNALVLRMASAWLGIGDVLRIVARGTRMTMVCATGGHYAEAVAATRLRKGSPRRARMIQVASAHTPLSEMVAALNAFRPAILAPYAGIGAQLAAEQEAGRLHIDPILVVLSAEGLPLASYERISRAGLPSGIATLLPNARSSATVATTTGCTSTATGWCLSPSIRPTGRSRRASSRIRSSSPT